MSERFAAPEDTSPGGTSKWKARAFALTLVALPICAFVVAIWIAKTGWFIQRVAPAYLRGLDSEYAIRNRQCDILVFGDSSALTGIEPRILTERTGMQACSVARTKGETGVLGTSFLERYLKQNPAPKFLVLAFAPEDWHPAADWGEVAYFEGVLQMVRYYSALETAIALVKRPTDAYSFTIGVYRQVLDRTVLRQRDKTADPSRDEGHMTLPTPTETACVTKATPGKPLKIFWPDAAYMAQLRQKFASAGTRVLLVVSPEPGCDVQRDEYMQALSPLVDITFPPYPITDYNDIDRHFNREGSAQYSRDLADALMARAKEQ